MPQIHPNAVVDPKAQIDENVEIGPNCVIGPHVTIGKGTKIIANSYIAGHTTIGEDNRIFPSVTLGTEPQDFGYKEKVSYLKIGNGNVFRENFTANPGTGEGSETVIGNNCYFMNNSHVAHNCIIGNNVILVGFSGVTGYVQMGDRSIVSGLCGVHQFCRVGRLAMLSGGSMISKDLPPFMIADGRNGDVKSINIIGMKRNGFSEEAIRAVKNIYKIFFRSGINMSEALNKIKEELPDLPEVREFVEFVEKSERGILSGRNTGNRD
jgi:UDP-N-acetylglucosamine acyltransferase